MSQIFSQEERKAKRILRQGYMYLLKMQDMFSTYSAKEVEILKSQKKEIKEALQGINASMSELNPNINVI